MRRALPPFLLRAAVFVAWFGALVPSAFAGSIIPPRDLGALASVSEAVVLARAGTSAASERGLAITMTTMFEVLDVVRGPLRGGAALRVETPGGVVGGRGWAVPGTPQFADGAVYLLFLNRQPDGAWQPRVMSYGLLRQVRGSDGTALLTPMDARHELTMLKRPDGASVEEVETYYQAPLLEHLRSVASRRTAWDASRVRVAAWAVPEQPRTAAKTSAGYPDPCVFMEYDGHPVRWSTFDEGGAVTIYAAADGDADMGAAAYDAVAQGIDTWQGIGDVEVNWSYGGTMAYTPDCGDGSAAPSDLSSNEGVVQFNDPCGEIPDLSFCTGTLAQGGSYFYTGASGRHEHRGIEWNTSAIAYIVVNNDVGTCLTANQYSLMMTHELGHTIGMGHISAGSGAANMNPMCCRPITSIDETCAVYSYSNVPLATTPAAVVLEAPATGAEGVPTSPQLSWQVSFEADSYVLQVSDDAGFSSLAVSAVGVTETSRQVGPLDPGTTYYWRVAGANTAGQGSWSEVRSFTTVAEAPGMLSLAAPADRAADRETSLYLEWDDVAGADAYHVQVSTRSSFSTTVVDDSVTARRYRVEGLDHETAYYWRARASNTAGVGPWSVTQSFTTMRDVPGIVALSTPQEGAADQPTDLAFLWESRADADAYHLQVSTDRDFHALVAEHRDVRAATQSVSGLGEGTRYYWRVRAANIAGDGAWSDPRNFTTLLNPPVAARLAAPAHEAVDQPTSLTLTWDAVRHAEVYDVQLSLADDFAEIAYQDQSVADTSLAVVDLAEHTAYYWRVRGVNDAGDGAWSVVRRFTTVLNPPPAVTLVGPEDAAADRSGLVTFSWEEGPTAARYHLQVGTDVALAERIVDVDTLQTTTLTVGPIAYNATYYWRVRGVNASGPGAWSAVRSLSTGVGTGVEPVGGEVPAAYVLHANYPNPFNPQTTIRFDLPERTQASVVVYDVRGRAVETLAAGVLAPGRYALRWDASDHPSGLYLVRLHTPSFSQARRMLLLK